MKFGKFLEDAAFEKFRGYYIQYKELKKAFKVLTGNEKDSSTVQEVTHWTSSFLRLGPNPEVVPEMRLQAMLRQELERISKFAGLEAQAIASQLNLLEEDAQKAGFSMGSTRSDQSASETMRARVDEIGESLVQLSCFAQVNFTGFRKICKKYDKWTARADSTKPKMTVSPWFMAEVFRAPFMSVDYETLLEQLNRIAVMIGYQADSAQVAVPRCRSTYDITVLPGVELTFLLDPKETIKVKVQLAKSLVRIGLPPTPTAPQAAAGAVRQLRPKTTSVYLDTDGLSVYGSIMAEARSDEGEAPQAVLPRRRASCHFRYADGDAVCMVFEDQAARSTEVLLERPEALRLLQGESAQPWDAVGPEAAARVQGPRPQATDQQAQAALAAARAVIKQGGQRPQVQASYARSRFQDENWAVVLDEDVRLAKCGGEPLGSAAPGSEHFPRNVLTVTCKRRAPAEEVPPWFRFVNDHYVRIPGFSKAAYAVAHFHAKGAAAKDPPFLMPLWYQNILSNMPGEPANDEGSDAGSVKSGDGERPLASPRVSSVSRAAPPPTSMPCSRLLHEFGTSPEDDQRQIEMSPANEPAEDAGDLAAPLLTGGGGKARPPREALKGGLLQRLGRRLRALLQRERLEQQQQQQVAEEEKGLRDAIVTVQPKTMYSNERTFLEWMHFATMVASFGVVTMHTMDTDEAVTLGRAMVLLSILMVGWSLRTFTWRADALDTKESRDYSDPIGPPVLVLCLLLSLVFSTIHALSGHERMLPAR